jgi:hypothetical protein
MQAWSEFLAGNAEHPLPYQESRESMLLTFAVLESIQRGSSVSLTRNDSSSVTARNAGSISFNPP